MATRVLVWGKNFQLFRITRFLSKPLVFSYVCIILVLSMNVDFLLLFIDIFKLILVHFTMEALNSKKYVSRIQSKILK